MNDAVDTFKKYLVDVRPYHAKSIPDPKINSNKLLIECDVIFSRSNGQNSPLQRWINIGGFCF